MDEGCESQISLTSSTSLSFCFSVWSW